MTYQERSNFITNIAAQYVGSTEKRGNQGWYNKTLERKMGDVGWNKGWAWCALFVELVWTDAYPDDYKMLKQLNELHSASATATYANFDKESNNPNSILDITTSLEPVPGAIVVWRFGNSWKGHCGIVDCIDGETGYMETIEGNTGASGSREGEGVYRKRRLIKVDTYKSKGLNLVGYIHPPKLK